MKSASFWITQLGLAAHPEGGFYKETYRSGETIPAATLPKRFRGDRNFSTSIYFLLRSDDRSLFHRIQSDELWNFHAGSALRLYVLNKGALTEHLLGDNPANGEALQVIIPAGSWFGAVVTQPDSYTLSGCVVSPGFDFKDFEMATRKSLLTEYPGYRDIIEMLTT